MKRDVCVISAMNGKEYSGEWNETYYKFNDKFKGDLFKIYIDNEAVTIDKNQLFELFDLMMIAQFNRDIIKDIMKSFNDLEDKWKCKLIQEIFKNMKFPTYVLNDVYSILNDGHGYDDFIN